MQKHVNLVDLDKSFPTIIFLQNLASLREGLDDLACLLACVDTAENEPLGVWVKLFNII